MVQPAFTTVFGGTGFLGSRVVTKLLAAGHKVRVATRHPDRARETFHGADDGLESVRCDVHDDDDVRRAVTGAAGAVNSVSLYVERHGQTFQAVHVDAAARVAAAAHAAGVSRLVHVSGIGSDPSSTSPYIRSRGMGEEAVSLAFPNAIVLRPAVMFGAGDSFVMPVADMLRRLPAFAMFGHGRTRLQPVWVEDVAEGILRLLQSAHPRPLYEFAGPDIITYAEYLSLLLRHLGSRTLLFPMPFNVWLAVAALAERLPSPPITRNQVQLMAIDNVAAAGRPGFGDLGLTPARLADKVRQLLTIR